MARASSSTMLLALGLLLMTLAGQCYGQLKVGYYKNKCKVDVEGIVFRVVFKNFLKDKDTIADLIRLQFHDCFVRGCDASVLLDGPNTEKTASPNASLDGFAVIEEAKVAVDKKCPGVVSCADIINIAARVAVYLGGAKWYEVETGRKDGRISRASEASRDLPSAFIPVPQAVQVFAQRGVNKEEFVVLLGCHTVGTAHCNNFQNRLYNSRGTGKSDPAIAPSLLATMKKTCPRNGNSNKEMFLDQTPRSQFKMDNGFYKAILARQGILQVDQDLAFNPLTRSIVQKLASNNNLFAAKIGPAMVKLGRAGVKLRGEVRRGTCRKVNRGSAGLPVGFPSMPKKNY